jgi:hypothetical protein
MKNHTVSLINAVVLITMSAWAYFTSENPSMTALIPGFIGIILIALNPGLKKENKIIAHIVVVLTLLIIIALIKPLKGAIDDGRTLSIVRVALMMLTSIWAITYFIKSFINARKSASS